MEPIALMTAALPVLGAPALAAVMWRRTIEPRPDAIEMVALGYGGVALAALSLWWGALLGGTSWPVMLVAALLGSTLLLAPALARRRAKNGRAPARNNVPRDAQREGGLPPSPHRHFLVLAAAGVVYATLVWLPFLTFGWQRPDGIHRMAMTDWYKHLVATTALTAAETFPPPNPFLHTADAAPYYYGFHLAGAGLARLGGAFARADPGELVFTALMLMTLMTAAATPFVAYTVARTLMGGRGHGGSGETAGVPLVASLTATFVAGFDLIPLAIDTVANLAGGAAQQGGFAALRAAIPSTHLDYWIHHDERQFNAPYLSTLWAPQHMAAVLTALLVMHLVLRRRGRAGSVAGTTAPGADWLLPALLLAALPALSAYVAIGLVIAVVGSAIIECLRRRCPPWHTDVWQAWLAPGLAAVAPALPVLWLLAGSGAGGGLTVRVSDAGSWSNGAVWSALFGAGWLTGVLDSIAVYAVELGIIGVLAAVEIRTMARQGRLSSHQRQVVGMIVALLVALVFLRPAAGEPNNLYARPLVLVWFALAPFAAMRLARYGSLASPGVVGAPEHRMPPTPGRGRAAGRARWAAAGLLLCLAANGYALLGVLLEGALFWATPAATVEAARWINDNAARPAVVAVAPDEFTSAFGYWLRRPLALADERHALLFGAPAERYREVADSLRRARQGAGAAVAADALRGAGGTMWLVARAGGDPPWAASACFDAPFRNAEWLVVVLVVGADCGARP